MRLLQALASPTVLTLAALLATAPAQANPGTVRDFQLPPAPTPTPTETPQAQGPVDVEGAVPMVPRVIPTDTPTPAATATPTEAGPSPTPSPRTTPTPRPTATGQPQRPVAAPPSQTDPGASAPEPVATSDPVPTEDAAGLAGLPTTLPQGLDAANITAPDETEEDNGSLWTWLLALVTGLAIAAGAFLVWRQRRATPATAAPAIEPPLARREPKPQPAPGPAPAPAVAPSAGLAIEVVPVHLRRSMMQASLAFRVTLVNRGGGRLENVALEADLVTAHASVPMTEQLADPARSLPQMGQIGAIEAGESVESAGEATMAIAAIRAIRQGAAQVYVPLLRVRALPEGGEPVARTFIVGTMPRDGARKLQPLRLDEIPQTYRNIGTAPID